MLIIKHGSQKFSKSDGKSSYSETWTGTKSEVDTYYAGLIPKTYYSGKGFLEQPSKYQEQGQLWSVDCTYSIEYSENGSAEDQLTGPQMSTLQGSLLSLPLEARDNYLTQWNYYLIGRDTNAKTIPGWYYTATDTVIDDADDFKEYRWVKNISEIPTEADSDGKFWAVVKDPLSEYVCNPTKPGVECFQKPVWQINETSKYSSKVKASWVTERNLGCIVSSPINGNFNINDGNWLVESGSVQFDGKKWVSQLTYTHSGDAEGWDADLYTTIID